MVMITSTNEIGYLAFNSCDSISFLFIVGLTVSLGSIPSRAQFCAYTGSWTSMSSRWYLVLRSCTCITNGILPPPPNLCLAVSYIECPYRSFNGRFGPLVDDLAQYLRMSSALLNSRGGTQHSTFRSVMGVDLLPCDYPKCCWLNTI